MDTPSQATAPVDLPPLLPQTERAMGQLIVAPALQAALAAVRRDDALTLAEQIALSEIESPPFHEEKRAADFARRLRLSMKAAGEDDAQKAAAPDTTPAP